MRGYVVAVTEDRRMGWLREAMGVRHFRFVAPEGPAPAPGGAAEYRLEAPAGRGERPVAVILGP